MNPLGCTLRSKNQGAQLRALAKAYVSIDRLVWFRLRTSTDFAPVLELAFCHQEDLLARRHASQYLDTLCGPVASAAKSSGSC
jgi:hypothetical protein